MSRKKRCTTVVDDERLAHRRHRLADVLSLSRQPAARLSYFHLRGDRYPRLGLPDPLPQFRFARRLQFRAGASWRGALVGFFDARDAAADDDPVRGCLDAKLPQFLRLSLAHVRIPHWAVDRRGDHQRLESRCDDYSRPDALRIVFPLLRGGDRSLSHGAVRHWHRARRRRCGLGVEAGPRLRMVDLANPDADLAIRGRVLPDHGFARMDAGDRTDPAADLRV